MKAFQVQIMYRKGDILRQHTIGTKNTSQGMRDGILVHLASHKSSPLGVLSGGRKMCGENLLLSKAHLLLQSVELLSSLIAFLSL